MNFFAYIFRQKERDRRRIMRLFVLCVLLVAALTSLFPVSKARANLCTWCACSSAAHRVSRAYIRAQHNITRAYITQQFIFHRTWWVYVYWRKYLLPAMMKMTEQLSAGALQQMEITGAFFDAKHQLETQALLQEMEAQAHKNYHTDVEICTIGTQATSLAFSERRGEISAFLLAQKLQDRQLLNANSTTTESDKTDQESRLEQFKKTYCDPHDNNNNLDSICGSGGPADRINKDIDFGRTIGQPLSLDLIYEDASLSKDEEDVLALASNLYAHNTLPVLPPEALADINNQDEYLDLRSVVAKRSVAENSFNALAGLKSASNNTKMHDSMAAILEEMGVPPTEINSIIGANPSYYAQMEFLTKKLYQRPEFYINLYGKPVNADRKAAAIKSVALMQNMDLYESQLRAEAILAVLLEMKIIKEHDDVQNRIGKIVATGTAD